MAFSRFSINRVWFSVNQKIPKFSSLASAWLGWYSIDARPIEIEIFSVFKYIWPIYSSMHHLCLGFTCIALFCIHLVVLQSYLSLFSHITCIHFAKLGTQLNLKIYWLIFESFVHSSICYFYVWTVENYFFKRYDG